MMLKLKHPSLYSGVLEVTSHAVVGATQALQEESPIDQLKHWPETRLSM